jgi:hypothetical protein
MLGSDLYDLKLSRNYATESDRLLVLSAIKVNDNDGQPVGQSPYPHDVVFQPYNATSVQALTCGLSMEEGSLTVDPQTKLPVEGAFFNVSDARYVLEDPEQIPDPVGVSWWTFILSNVRRSLPRSRGIDSILASGLIVFFHKVH